MAKNPSGSPDTGPGRDCGQSGFSDTSAGATKKPTPGPGREGLRNSRSGVSAGTAKKPASGSPGLALLSIEAMAADSSHLLQSGFWAAFKESSGWRALAFRVRRPGFGGDAPLLVLVRPLAAGFSLAYVPHGPEPGEPPPDCPCSYLEALSRALKPHLPRRCLFIRYDVPWGTEGADNFPPPFCPPFRKARLDIQPPDTVVLDLGKSEEALLAEMKPKTRYNIRLAEKKGVRVYPAPPSSLPRWYGLYRETAARDGISLHREEYYRSLFDMAATHPGPRPRLHLLFAEAEGRLVAGVIVAVFGIRAYYLYGAASNELRNYMASYALQWSAIRLAREEGARSYDLFGIPPRDDPDHAMYGLYRFKTGFGGTILHRPGSWDYPLRPLCHRAYRGAEALRVWYHKSFRKRRAARGRGGS